MSILIRNRQAKENDCITLADDAVLPSSGKIIVSLKRWHDVAPILNACTCTVGVIVSNTCSIPDIWPELKSLSLIGLEFPTFGDGRAYSQARVLRDRFDFKGDIRAVGAAVVQDQLYGMHRCGISSFLLRDDQNAANCLKALSGFSAAYQMGSDNLRPVLFQRRS